MVMVSSRANAPPVGPVKRAANEPLNALLVSALMVAHAHRRSFRVTQRPCVFAHRVGADPSAPKPLINARANRATTAVHANRAPAGSDAYALADSPVQIAELMLMNAHRNRVLAVQHASMASVGSRAFVRRDGEVCDVKSVSA